MYNLQSGHASYQTTIVVLIMSSCYIYMYECQILCQFSLSKFEILALLSSAESQKGAIADQRCSIENQKGAIAIDFVQR